MLYFMNDFLSSLILHGTSYHHLKIEQIYFDRNFALIFINKKLIFFHLLTCINSTILLYAMRKAIILIYFLNALHCETKILKKITAVSHIY